MIFVVMFQFYLTECPYILYAWHPFVPYESCVIHLGCWWGVSSTLLFSFASPNKASCL